MNDQMWNYMINTLKQQDDKDAAATFQTAAYVEHVMRDRFRVVNTTYVQHGHAHETDHLPSEEC
jgi:rubrerythrin